MKIAIDIREILRSKTTGIGRYLSNFLQYLSNTKRRNDYLLYGNQNTDYDATPNTLKTKTIQEHFTLTWDNLSLPINLRRDNIDLLFSPFDKAPLFSNIPYIITIHDLLFIKHTAYPSLKTYFYNEFYKLYHRQIAKKATKIITVSNYSKKDIREIYNIAEQKIEVIPNSISERFHPIARSKVNSFLDNKNIDDNYILYVGNFKPHKNVSTLVRAYADLPSRIRENNKLILCGHKSNSLSSIKRIIDSLNLKGEIKLLHNISDEQLPKLYSGASLFVFPSLYEGFGLPPLEAMACGTPVICSNRTSLPEVVGESALLFNPQKTDVLANKISTVLTKSNLHQELKNKGLERTKKFSPKKVLPKLIQTIEEAARKKC